MEGSGESLPGAAKSFAPQSWRRSRAAHHHPGKSFDQDRTRAFPDVASHADFSFRVGKRESLQHGRRDYVFTDSLGRPLSQEQLAKRVWNPTIAKIGLSSRGQYNIRDTFITLALTAGEDPGWGGAGMRHQRADDLRSLPDLDAEAAPRPWPPTDRNAGFGAQIAPQNGPEQRRKKAVRRGNQSVRGDRSVEKWRRGELNPRPEVIH